MKWIKPNNNNLSTAEIEKIFDNFEQSGVYIDGTINAYTRSIKDEFIIDESKNFPLFNDIIQNSSHIAKYFDHLIREDKTDVSISLTARKDKRDTINYFFIVRPLIILGLIDIADFLYTCGILTKFYMADDSAKINISSHYGIGSFEILLKMIKFLMGGGKLIGDSHNELKLENVDWRNGYSRSAYVFSILGAQILKTGSRCIWDKNFDLKRISNVLKKTDSVRIPYYMGDDEILNNALLAYYYKFNIDPSKDYDMAPPFITPDEVLQAIDDGIK